MRYELTRFFNTLAIYLLGLVVLGAYIYQYTLHQDPCPLCELQRLAMISAAVGLMLNLRFIIRPFHYAIGLASSIFGGSVSLRQITLHICPGFPTFGTKVLGFELYTWAFIVFASTLIGITLLLLLYRAKDSEKKLPLSIYEKVAIYFIFMLAIGNFFTTLFQCGVGPCSG